MKKLIIIIGIVPLICLIAVYVWQGISDLYYEQHSTKITVEGYDSHESLGCRGSSVSISVIYSPTPYELVDKGNLAVGKRPSSYEGKHVRVQGITNGKLVPVCLYDKPQYIHRIIVSDVEPL